MTNETKYTPGPWSLDGHNLSQVIHKFQDTGNIWRDWETIAKCGDNANWMANARLIAAAPELLEALEDLVNWHETKSPDAALKDQLIKDAWVAVDKARGQS